ncbi:cellulase family glycosylhydrolase [Williamsia sp. SKLECPSW1]
MAALVLLTVLSACTPSPRSDPGVPTTPTPLAAPTPLARVGVSGGTNLIGSDAVTIEKSMRAMNDLGVSLLRMDIAWPAVEPADGVWNWGPTDSVVNAARRHGIEILGILDYTPAWAAGRPGPIAERPASAARFGEFAANAARHLAGRVDTFEIWNEPNGGYYFQPGPDPVAYTRLLRAAYRALKSVDRDITVVGGAIATAVDSDTTMNGLRFLKGVYAAGGAGYFDALSVHPYSYPASFNSEPHDPDSAMRMVADMYATMRAHGDGGKKVWASEIGYPTTGDLPTDPQTQADVVARSVAQWSQLSYAGPVIVHELRDRRTGSSDKEDSFGILHTDFSPKPAYQRLRELVRRGVVDDEVYQRVVAAAATGDAGVGGAVTPWYREMSPRGIPVVRQEFTGGEVICARDDCYATPGPVVAYLASQRAVPDGPFVRGRQPARGIRPMTVFWTSSTGVHGLSGDMLDAWRPEYGFPTTDEYVDGDTRVVRCTNAVMRKPFGESVRVQVS